MLTKELIDLVAGKMNFSKVQSKEVIELILNTIYESAAADGECLVGDHRFKLKKVAERQGRNPNTGEPMVIPAKTYVTYRRAV